jgi:anti-sigma regulatory factor (Ser/Thr protein kinase)
MKQETWLPAVPQSAPRARALVGEAAAGCGLDADAAWALMLATTEAVANAIKHGGACAGRPDAIGVLIEARGEELSVEVRDCGSFQSPVDDGNSRPRRGHGIPLMVAVVDQLAMVGDAGETCVRFAKRPAAA